MPVKGKPKKEYQMEAYELTSEQITTWAIEYASYEELEQVAKGLYGVYVQRRKHEHPDQHRKAKAYKSTLRKQPHKYRRSVDN